MSSRTATLIGFAAIAQWSLLALLTVASGRVPPFELAALTFAIAAVAGLAIAAARGRLAAVLPTAASLALGLYGLFGDTVLYFAALKLAPAAEASLIHYLWPLLMVLFAAALPGGALRLRHVAGALMGLAATVLLVGERLGTAAPNAHLGYALAFAGAFVWASFSVGSGRLGEVPTESITATCATSAVLSLLCHLAFERTVWPGAASEWIAVIGLGLGPMGTAFFLWDIGMKRGDVPFIAVLSYAAPVLSTAILVAAGYARPSLSLALACVLIVAGAVLAGRARRG